MGFAEGIEVRKSTDLPEDANIIVISILQEVPIS